MCENVKEKVVVLVVVEKGLVSVKVTTGLGAIVVEFGKGRLLNRVEVATGVIGMVDKVAGVRVNVDEEAVAAVAGERSGLVDDVEEEINSETDFDLLS